MNLSHLSVFLAAICSSMILAAPSTADSLAQAVEAALQPPQPQQPPAQVPVAGPLDSPVASNVQGAPATNAVNGIVEEKKAIEKAEEATGAELIGELADLISLVDSSPTMPKDRRQSIILGIVETQFYYLASFAQRKRPEINMAGESVIDVIIDYNTKLPESIVTATKAKSDDLVKNVIEILKTPASASRTATLKNTVIDAVKGLQVKLATLSTEAELCKLGQANCAPNGTKA